MHLKYLRVSELISQPPTSYQIVLKGSYCVFFNIRQMILVDVVLPMKIMMILL